MTEHNSDTSDKIYKKPDFFRSSSVWLGRKKTVIFSIASLMIIIVISGIFAVFSTSKTKISSSPVKDAVGWEILRIDGNRNGTYVDFDHEAHKALIKEGRIGCRVCHHLSKPHDGPSSCYQCHRDMEKTASIFDHNYHIRIYTSGNSCEECHIKDKSEQNVKRCNTCHDGYNEDIEYYSSARGYKSAMHTLCIGCHGREDDKTGKKVFTKCSFCHGD